MGGIESVSLANKFGIALGCLVWAAFLAGLFKLYLKKRKLRHQIQLVDEYNAQPRAREKFQTRRKSRLSEGDLFGSRALEAGYYGGVSQAQQDTTVTSPAAAVLSPNHIAYQWNQNEKRLDTSVCPTPVYRMERSYSSVSRKSSLRIAPIDTARVKRKPAPLNILEAITPTIASRTDSPGAKYGIAVSSYLPGNYMAPLPSPGSGRSFISSSSEATSGWVSPSEANFYKATSPKSLSDLRPTSYLPRLNFTEERSTNGLITATPAGSVNGRKSVVPSLFNFELSAEPTPLPKIRDHPRYGSPIPQFSVYPHISHARGQGSRSIFPRGDVDEMPTSSYKRIKAWKQSATPPLLEAPLTESPISPVETPESPIVPGNQFKSENMRDSAILRDSIVSERTVSSYESDQETIRNESSASLYSIPDSIIDEAIITPQPSRKSSKRSKSSCAPRNQSSTFSYHQRRSHSTHTLARARNSLLAHYSSRRSSNTPINLSQPEDQAREQIQPERSGARETQHSSTAGQQTYFDQLHRTHIANLHYHSPAASTSSQAAFPLRKFEDDSARAAQSFRAPRRGRDRRGSRDSIGDLYDSYYEPSDRAVQGENLRSKLTPPPSPPRSKVRNQTSHVPFLIKADEAGEALELPVLRPRNGQEEKYPNMF